MEYYDNFRDRDTRKILTSFFEVTISWKDGVLEKKYYPGNSNLSVDEMENILCYLYDTVYRECEYTYSKLIMRGEDTGYVQTLRILYTEYMGQYFSFDFFPNQEIHKLLYFLENFIELPVYS